MFVFLVPLNRPKEESKARSCVTATPGRAGPGGVGRPHAPARGCWRRGNRSREQSSRSSQASGSLPPKCPAEPPSLPPSGPGQPPPAWSLFFPLTPQFGPAAAADLWQDFCSGREGKKAIDFNRISPQTLLVCCCYASIWRSLFINERVRSVAKTLRARICVTKLRAGWRGLAGWWPGTERDVTCRPAFPEATPAPRASSPRRRRCGPGAAPCSLPAVLLNTTQAGFPVYQVPPEE